MVETSPLFTELPPDRRAEAMMRYDVLRPHLDESVPLASVAVETDTPLRTLQRWLARYRWQGLAGLARAARSDRGTRQLPPALVAVIEGIALQMMRSFSWAGQYRRRATPVITSTRPDIVVGHEHVPEHRLEPFMAMPDRPVEMGGSSNGLSIPRQNRTV